MENEKDLEARLSKMKEDIKEATDKELNTMGMETMILCAVLAKQLGPDSENTKVAESLLSLLRAEDNRRKGRTQTQAEPEVVAKQKFIAPQTFNELMSLGNGDVREPEMVKSKA